MSWNDNPPSLALSDIMHHMSPSPIPVEEHSTPTQANTNTGGARNEREMTPEPITEADVLSIRKRLHEMGFSVASPSKGPEEAAPLSSSLDGADNASSREKELVDIILRLTSYMPVDPAQLDRQAAAISTLTAQRDYLMAQAEEEQWRWRSERENWNRSAEALLTQKTRVPKSEDAERQRLAYEIEIIALRDKVHDRTRRLSALEQELVRLKPLLLMQPYSSNKLKHGLTSQPHSSKHHVEKDKGKRREVDSGSSKTHLITITEEKDSSYIPASERVDQSAYTYGYQYQPHPPSQIVVESPLTTNPGPSSTIIPSSSEPITVFEAHVPPPASPPHRRRSRDRTHGHKAHSRKSKYHIGTPISSDAYAEHILLAAQRIGRRRAAVVTGVQQLAEREKELLAREQDQLKAQKDQERMEKERLERLASGTSGMAYYRPSTDAMSPQGGTSRSGPSSTIPPPRTPKRTGYPTFSIGPNNNANPGGVNTPPPSTYVFVNTSATPLAKVPIMYSPNNMSNSPAHLGAPVNLATSSRKTPAPSTPHTPLDSLLDAARSMMGDGAEKGPTAKPTNGRRRPLEEPESPMSKRRKVSSDKPPPNRGRGPNLDRVRSALDVLADQAAAAFHEPDQPVRRPSATAVPSGVSGRNGKGKAKSPGLGESEVDAGSSSRTRTSSRTVRPTRKHGISPDRGTSTSASTSGRGTAKSRGRNKATASSVTSKHQEVSEVGPRVIARSHIPPTGNFAPGQSSLANVGLRPVVGWGNRPAIIDDDDEEDSDPSMPTGPPTRRNGTQIREYIPRPSLSRKDPGILRPTTPFMESDKALEPVHSPNGSERGQEAQLQSKSRQTTKRKAAPRKPPRVRGQLAGEDPPIEPVHEPSPLDLTHPSTIPSRRLASPTLSTQPVQTLLPSGLSPCPDVQMEIPPLEEIADDAEADVNEDVDAEGEQEDDADEDAETSVTKHPSRSRSPPPPDPPGPDNGTPPDADDDADADAEGEIDETEETPSSSMSSAARQARATPSGAASKSCRFLETPSSMLFLLAVSIPSENISHVLGSSQGFYGRRRKASSISSMSLTLQFSFWYPVNN